MNNVEKVIDNIRKLREAKHYPQAYVANRLKISQNAYSKLELGLSRLTVARMYQLAHILECDVYDLLKE